MYQTDEAILLFTASGMILFGILLGLIFIIRALTMSFISYKQSKQLKEILQVGYCTAPMSDPAPLDIMWH